MRWRSAVAVNLIEFSHGAGNLQAALRIRHARASLHVSKLEQRFQFAERISRMADLQSMPVSEQLKPGCCSDPTVNSKRLRHPPVRATHWIVALSFLALFVSGIEILISHPRFYWGENGNVLTPVLFKLPIPSSRSLVPTGYGYVLPDQNGWSRYLHFQSAWLGVLSGLVYVAAGFGSGHFRRICCREEKRFRGGRFRRRLPVMCASNGRVRQRRGLTTCCSSLVTYS